MRPFKLLVVAVALLIQLVLSVEMDTTPAAPTATNFPAAKTMPFRVCGPDCGFPSGSGLRQCQLSSGAANVVKLNKAKPMPVLRSQCIFIKIPRPSDG